MGEVVPVGVHPTDKVLCSDDEVRRKLDAYVDLKGEYHSTDEDRDEVDEGIVHSAIDEACMYTDDYTTNPDYAEGYSCLVDDACNWSGDITEWVEANLPDIGDMLVEAYAANTTPEAWDDYMDDNGLDVYEDIENELERIGSELSVDEMIEAVCRNILDFSDYDFEYSANEYACYTGPGCCIGSFEIGEVEEMRAISDFEGFTELHEQGRLEGFFDTYNGDACLYEHSRYDENTKRRVKTGYLSGDTLTYYSLPGGQWHFVVDANVLEQLVRDVCIDMLDVEIS